MSAEEQRKIAENQVEFRRQNESIEAGADATGLLSPIPFVCECSDPGCQEIVHLSLDEYEEVRAEPRDFFTLPGHQQAAVDAGSAETVRSLAEYVVVRKIGIAGRFADATYRELAG